MLLVVTGNLEGRGSPRGTWPPRAGARIEHTSLVAHPGLFPLLVQNILFLCPWSGFWHAHVYVSLHLSCFFHLLIQWLSLNALQTLFSVTMKRWVSTLLVAWFGVLSCVQAEFFTSIGMCQQDCLLPEQSLAQVPGNVTT